MGFGIHLTFVSNCYLIPVLKTAILFIYVRGHGEKGPIVQNYIFEKFMVKLCILIKMTNYMTCNGIN